MVENMGPEKILGSSREVGDKLFPQAVAFTFDKQPQPRYYGRMALQILATDESAFSKALNRYCTDSQAKAVRDILAKGLGDVPQSNLHGPVVASTSNGPSTGAQSQNGPTKTNTLNRHGSQRKRPPGKLPDQVQIQLENAEKHLISNEWQTRQKGLEEFESLCKDHAKTVSQNVKLVEGFNGRLNDINKNVASQALAVFLNVLPKLSAHFAESSIKGLIGDMLKALMAQLPSKTEEIRQLALKGLDACVKHLEICQNVYSSKPRLVEMHAVPVLWDLLAEKQGEIGLKKATQEYARLLSKTMGKKNLTDMANTTQKQQLEQML